MTSRQTPLRLALVLVAVLGFSFAAGSALAGFQGISETEVSIVAACRDGFHVEVAEAERGTGHETGPADTMPLSVAFYSAEWTRADFNRFEANPPASNVLLAANAAGSGELPLTRTTVSVFGNEFPWYGRFVGRWINQRLAEPGVEAVFNFNYAPWVLDENNELATLYHDVPSEFVGDCWLFRPIDVMPGSTTNDVNPAKGSVSVELLSAPGFDATAVNATSLRLGDEPRHPAFPVLSDDLDPFAVAGGPPFSVSRRDVNGDRVLDLLVHFKMHRTGISCGDTEAVLAGMTTSGAKFRGQQAIRTPAC